MKIPYLEAPYFFKEGGTNYYYGQGRGNFSWGYKFKLYPLLLINIQTELSPLVIARKVLLGRHILINRSKFKIFNISYWQIETYISRLFAQVQTKPKTPGITYTETARPRNWIILKVLHFSNGKFRLYVNHFDYQNTERTSSVIIPNLSLNLFAHC